MQQGSDAGRARTHRAFGPMSVRFDGAMPALALAMALWLPAAALAQPAGLSIRYGWTFYDGVRNWVEGQPPITVSTSDNVIAPFARSATSTGSGYGAGEARVNGVGSGSLTDRRLGGLAEVVTKQGAWSTHEGSNVRAMRTGEAFVEVTMVDYVRVDSWLLPRGAPVGLNLHPARLHGRLSVENPLGSSARSTLETHLKVWPVDGPGFFTERPFIRNVTTATQPWDSSQFGERHFFDPVTVTDDVLFKWEWRLRVSADAGANDWPTFDPTRVQALASFGNTLSLGGIASVFDPGTGQVIDGWTVTSAAGIDWTLPAVPEPGTWTLLAAGLAGLAVLRRRRASSR